MRMALRLAEKTKGWTSPHPMVGAVVVKNNRAISSGIPRKGKRFTTVFKRTNCQSH
jgi:diaminohydroxyphosphoribosylaminopyrimidine deaminase/5-amino-6-(5-phosphoribosylamino)uracil reductase